MTESSNRVTKRTAEIRKRLLFGALKAFAEHGIRSAKIAQITEAADVGFGTFYNHFESREAAVDAVREVYVYRYAKQLKKMKNELEDPAERVSSAVRHKKLCFTTGRDTPIISVS